MATYGASFTDATRPSGNTNVLPFGSSRPCHAGGALAELSAARKYTIIDLFWSATSACPGRFIVPPWGMKTSVIPAGVVIAPTSRREAGAGAGNSAAETSGVRSRYADRWR